MHHGRRVLRFRRGAKSDRQRDQIHRARLGRGAAISTNDGELCLEVRDSGVGIDAKFLPKLFQPFVQEDSGFSRKFEGSGLGLALTKRFLEANHARIR